jgi:hypothetical protein
MPFGADGFVLPLEVAGAWGEAPGTSRLRSGSWTAACCSG